MRAAWSLTDADLAEQRLQLLATELDRTWPDAAASLREGMHDTLTLMRLGITGKLATDAVLDEPVRVDDRDRPLHPAQREALARRRHAQALDRRRHARRRAAVPRIIGYRDLAKLVIAIERHATHHADNTTHTTLPTVAPKVVATAV